MNSDLGKTKEVIDTSNPQGTGAAAGASDSSAFQNSAGPEVLTQNHSLQVTDNGKPITSSGSREVSAGTYIVIIIGAIAFLLICARLLRWVKQAPPAFKLEPTTSSLDRPLPKKKKKLPRSKRYSQK